MKKISNSITCGLAAILATIILYFIVLGNIFAQMICFITLLGVIVAECAVVVMAYFSKGEPRKIAATAVVSLMIPIAIILSIVYIVDFPEKYGSYVGCYFLSFALIAAISSVIWNFANNRKKDNYSLQNAKDNMLYMRKLVKCIMLKSSASDYKRELNEIEEKLHYSNDAVIVEMDANIRKMLVDLENSIDDEGFDTKEAIKAIANEIERRNLFAR